MKIRKYKSSDFEATKYICVHDMIGKNCDDLLKYVEVMFCRYYLEKEPENCFVAVDENDKPIGYVYGAADYDTYQNNFTDYIKRVAEISNRTFLKDALTEMFDHAIYKDKYPAHLHIDILPEYQSKGVGSKLITAFCDDLKERGINGVMLIVGSDNTGARRFYERNGFTLLQDIESGAAYGKTL